MKKYILNCWLAIIILVLSIALIVVQVFTYTDRRNSATIYEGPCAFASWSQDGEYLRLNLDCNGQRAHTTDSGVIIEYLKSESSIKYTLLQSGEVILKK